MTLGPDKAFRFARGEEVTATHGERLNLSRPLDFLVVSDHSDAMGAMNEIISGNPMLLREPLLRDWHDRINKGGETAFEAAIEVVETSPGITGKKIPDVIPDPACNVCGHCATLELYGRLPTETRDELRHAVGH